MCFLDVFEINRIRSIPTWYQIFSEMIENREISLVKHERKFKLRQQDQPLERLISYNKNFDGTE